MNLTINPIHFYSQSKKTISTQKNATSSYQAKNLLPDYNYALALKNQILFCANIKPQEKEAQYQEIIDKYNLDLSPQKLKEIFSPQALNSRLKIKQARKGSRAFRAFSRSTLHSCFPNKSEEELTDIIPSITREKNKARIIRTLIPRELLKNNPRKSQNELYSQYFNLLLSTIINEGKEDGYKNVQNFLDDFVAPILIPPYRTIKRNEFEELENCIRLQGKNPEDLYTQTRIFRDKCRYRFFYQDKLLAEEFNSELNSEARTKGIQKAIQAIEDKKINLDEPQKEKPYADYRFADKERIKK